MSWPHILSSSRIVVGPIVAALVLAPPGDVYLVAAVLFALASLTDLIDGKLARYSQSSSPLGVFLDTTSDKIMVSVVLIAMALARLSPGWVVMVIVGREFLISGLRSYAASNNRVISAHIWGKGKAAITMVVITAVLLVANGRAGGVLTGVTNHTGWSALYTVSQWSLGLAAVLTIVSGVRYFIDAQSLFQQESSTPVVPRDRPRAVGEGR